MMSKIESLKISRNKGDESQKPNEKAKEIVLKSKKNMKKNKVEIK